MANEMSGGGGSSGVFNNTPPVLVNGQRGDLQQDSSGNLKVTLATLIAGEDLTNLVTAVIQKPVAGQTYAPSLSEPLTLATSNFVKSSPGNVLSFYVTNDNAAVRYFQLHNKTTAPVATNVPLLSFKIPAGTANNPGVLQLGEGFFTPTGTFFSTGIGYAISTTLGTFTNAATASEHITAVQYI